MTHPRHRAPRKPSNRLTGRVVVAAAVFLIAVAAPAQAFWTAVSTGSGARAQAGSLAAPTLTAGSVTATTATLSWATPFAPTAYDLAQSPDAITGCPAAPSVSSTGCTATSLTPNTQYTWNLTASDHSWTVAAVASATTSKQGTTTTVGTISATTADVGSTFSATATVTGNSGYGTPAGTVVFGLYASATCSGTAAYSTSALALSGGRVTGSVDPGAGTYYWRATYTPTDSYNLTSVSACSSAVTVVPTSALRLNWYGVYASNYDGSGHPTALTGGLSVQSTHSSVSRTINSVTVTASFPDSRVSGAAPDSVTGTGWSYESAAHVGSEWVYTFTWTGSLALYGSTETLQFTIPLSNNDRGRFDSTATAWSFYSDTSTRTTSIRL